MRKRLLACASLLLVSFAPHRAVAKPPSCVVTSAKGDIRYRRVGSLNWVSLANRKELFVGDLLFTRNGASARIEYVAVGAAVELPPQTLFRVGETPPTYTKLRRRFALESNNAKVQDSRSSQNPFERVQVKNPEEDGSKQATKDSKSSLRILREKSPLQLATPQMGDITLSTIFPAKLTLRVEPEFAGKKMWAYLWGENDKVNPIWSGFSTGEFSAIPIPAPGRYSVQAMSDDETQVSEMISVEFRKQKNANDKNQSTGSATGESPAHSAGDPSGLSDILKDLRNKRDSNYTITVE